ncbi:type III-D CRISPR-associated RAMP protein Csx10 [Nostoc sp.]|uniref:type III-D CRISPR-associated RAMP protein Csx10 n=1 Tax=Nostoc sp. TaxID=1180 RepID=UPI002FF9CFB8
MTQPKKRIEMTITALSPLAIGREKPGGSISEVEQYIPGSVLRGAIAKQILQTYGMELENLADSDNDFQQLFLDDNSAIFQNAYPAIAKDKQGYKLVHNTPIKVLPATAVSSKANPGFTSTGHGVFDTLIDSFCAGQFHYPYDPSSLKALEDKVDARVEAYSCLYSKHGNQYFSHSVNTRLLTRVGINRRRATAAEDILYSLEVLNEAQKIDTKSNKWINCVYRCFIILPHESLAKKLKQFISINSKSFRLGGSVSRGLGKVEISVKENKINHNIKDRIKLFNQSLKQRWLHWSNAFLKPKNNQFDNRTYFTIDLQSDAILIDNWQRTTVISAAMLKQFVDNVEDESLELHTAYSSYDYCSGWNSAWGLMKDVELVTNKGSVYLFSTTVPKLWYEKLFDLELRGIGERVTEGFGQIEICNEFHLVFREEAV